MKNLTKLKPLKEKVGKHGEIRIPPEYLEGLGIVTGQEVSLSPMGKGVFLEPVNEAAPVKPTAIDPVDALTGSLPLPPELIDEIVENEYLYEPQEVD